MFVLLFVFGTLFVFLIGVSSIKLLGDFSPVAKITSKNSILHLELEGVILDGTKLLKPLVKYRKESRIKAIVVEVNSPGGVVGPSQEIYEELKKTSQMGKPVVVVSNGLIASGAYYAAVAADHIMVAPGALVGSIGVIMEFTNLEKLYDWAKISRYSIHTGKYKDSGAEYRSMRPDEKQLFQSLLTEVFNQFKKTVAEGRKLKIEEVEPYADGRVFTGEQAVQWKFADSTGTVRSAFDKAAELAGLGTNYEIFTVPKHRPGLVEILTGGEESDDWSTESKLNGNPLEVLDQRVLKSRLTNRPLYLMPGSW